jgi:hypothetical protein
MWGTVLALALVAGVDPGRIAVAVLLCARRRPVLHLAALWLGGLAVGVILGLAVLFGLHEPALAVLHRVQLATSSSVAGQIQIAVGVLALVAAAQIAVGFPVRHRVPAAAPGSDPPPPAPPNAVSRLSTRALDALRAGPPWLSFLVGVGITTDFRYLAALTAILASGTALGTQVGAAALYTVVGLAFAEIPLASHLAAPGRTGAVMSQLHDWVRARRRGALGVIVAVLGVFLVITGMGHI